MFLLEVVDGAFNWPWLFFTVKWNVYLCNAGRKVVVVPCNSNDWESRLRCPWMHNHFNSYMLRQNLPLCGHFIEALPHVMLICVTELESSQTQHQGFMEHLFTQHRVQHSYQHIHCNTNILTVTCCGRTCHCVATWSRHFHTSCWSALLNWNLVKHSTRASWNTCSPNTECSILTNIYTAIQTF